MREPSAPNFRNTSGGEGHPPVANGALPHGHGGADGAAPSRALFPWHDGADGAAPSLGDGMFLPVHDGADGAAPSLGDGMVSYGDDGADGAAPSRALFPGHDGGEGHCRLSFNWCQI